MRDGDWKLIEFYDPPAVELYHLGVDLGEEQDLAERHPVRVAAMRGQLAHWLADVGATLHTPNPAFRGEHAGEASGR